MGDYTARIEYVECDNVFVGRVLVLRSIISFHSETVAYLRHDSELASEDLLNDCQ